jgi:hypothetical protein
MDNHDIRIITNYEINSIRDDYLDNYQTEIEMSIVNTNNSLTDNFVNQQDNLVNLDSNDTRINIINIMSIIIILGSTCI